VAIAMIIGLALNYVGLNAVRMLFWTAVINGVLAPPLILLVVLLTGNPKVMGERANPPLLRGLGWVTFAVMVAAAVGIFVTS
jgi:Mn2+/Fe2+ NRAMP family transporter